MPTSQRPSPKPPGVTRRPRPRGSGSAPTMEPPTSPARHPTDQRLEPSIVWRPRSRASRSCTTWSRSAPPPDPSGRHDVVVEQNATAPRAELDRAADRAIALGGEVRRLADEGIVERTVAGNLVDQTNFGEGLGPIFLPVALRPNG